MLLCSIPFLAGCQLNQRARAADVSHLPVGFKVGERAPEFDLLAVGENRNIRSRELQGKPVILNFYCGCNFCSVVGKEWVNNKDKVGNAAVLAVMSNHWTYAPGAVQQFRARTGWTWTTLADLHSRVTTEFNAVTCPRVFVLDPQGVIRYASKEGASDEKQIIKEALAAVRGR
jgi:peroxiredoxin